MKSKGLSCLAVSTLLAVVLVVGAMPSVQAQTFTLLHTFGGPPDGASPNAGLIQDAAGNLYGTTNVGGITSGVCATGGGCGTIFKIATAGAESVLYQFTGGADGLSPGSGLVLDGAGNLYGSTGAAIFKLDTTTGTLTLLHSPGSGAGLIADVNGNLYGTSSEGIFKLDPGGTFTVVNSTAKTSALLAVDGAGNIYGTTGTGGNTNSQCSMNSCGTVFKVDTSGAYSVVHSFNADGHDGFNPAAGVIVDPAGNLYGTTWSGGAPNCIGGQHNPVGCGTVFKIDAAELESVLNFQGGDFPNIGVVRDTAGNLFGATQFSGPAAGTPALLYKMTPNGVETVLFTFTGGMLDRAYPTGNLLLDSNGNLFGTTQSGGGGAGTVFRLNPTGPPTYAVTVAPAGTGAGTVVGNPPVINCVPVCSAFLTPGTAVSLTATAASNSTFAGWSGPCSGTGSCRVTSGTAEVVVFATFNLIPADFSLSASALSPSTVTAGGSSSSMIQIAAAGGFSGSVAFTCSVQPAPALAPTCKVSPSSATPGTPVTLAVSTRGPTTAAMSSNSVFSYVLWLPLCEMLLLRMRSSSTRAKRGRLTAVAWASMLCAGVVSQVACGGVSKTIVNPGTPSGPYTVTVTGTSSAATGSLEHSSNTMFQVK
jgi:uncharacterized repeat protein (TIGR03803 family)